MKRDRANHPERKELFVSEGLADIQFPYTPDLHQLTNISKNTFTKFIKLVLALSLVFTLSGCEIVAKSALTSVGNGVTVHERSLRKGDHLYISPMTIDRLNISAIIRSKLQRAGYKLDRKRTKNSHIVYFNYNYEKDLFQYTLTSFELIISKPNSDKTIVDAYFQAFSPFSATTQANDYMDEIIEKVNL